MNDPEQAVVANDAGNDTPVESGDALESLLSEYEEATQPTQAEQQQTNDSNELLDLLKKREERDVENEAKEAEKTVETDIASAVESVQGHLEGGPVKLSNEAIDDMLNGLARRDPRFAKAFTDRHQNPQAWSRILKSAAKKISENNSIDPNLTEDREAVANAVKSASTATEADDQHTHQSLSKMSDTEFEIWKSSLK